MFESIDIDIQWLVEFAAGGGLPGWITGAALLGLAIRQKAFILELAKIALNLDRNVNALERNTEAVKERTHLLAEAGTFDKKKRETNGHIHKL